MFWGAQDQDLWSFGHMFLRQGRGEGASVGKSWGKGYELEEGYIKQDGLLYLLSCLSVIAARMQ